ncbi:MAG: HYR domain-containing protein [Flavobacteriales bacterium]|nr:HYR domain-containing protein [Flavobacteriales bacterium]
MIGFSSLLLSTAQAQAPSGDPEVFNVHDKLASSEQGADLNFGSAVAMDGEVLIAADDNEHVEVFRKAGDGSWSLEAVIPAPISGTEFGAREALATNGDWIAIGAKLDDTYENNAGAVHMYKYDGLDWQYTGSLSHMAPFGSIVTDWFGMAVAMDGNRMVVGSRAENGVGAAGAVHYFEYNAMLDMWLESGFIASQHTEGNSTSKFAESVDISGDYMIVGEHRNNTNGQFAGAAHIYAFYNQCWHHQNVFYGHNAQDILGKDVAISGTTAVAGSPFADTDDLNEAGAVTLYRLLPFSGGDSAWAETAHFAPDGTSQGDWVGSAVDIDGSLLAVGVPRDDEFIINGGAGYFLFDCTDGALTCVNEGFACDAMQNDRLGFDVAVSEGLAAIGATLDDNIYENAGSVYILGMDDLGFECDLTAPGTPETDLLTSDDTGVNAYDDTTRQTTPDFDVILPGGGGLSVTADYLAEAGDAVVFYMEGTGDSSIVILTQEDIDNGAVNVDFVYPGPVLEDGEYTFCSYLIDVFGNVGPTDCTTILIDNADPEPIVDFGTSAVAGSDTTLYLDANGGIDLDVQGQANISASDNIAMDTIYVDITEFDCSDAGNIVTVTLTAVDLAGNQATTTFDVAIEDEVAPVAIAQDITVQLNGVGSATITPEQIDNGSNDACGIATLSLDKTTFDCTEVGPNTVTLTVTDNHGNTATATATVTVEDNVAPTAVAQDLTVQLDATGAVSITPEQLNNGSSNACGIESMTLDISSFTCADVGPNTVTLTVTDSNGNVSTATATVTVEDNVLPAMVTQDITVQLDASGAVSITAAQIDNGTSDACGIDTLYLDTYDFDCDDQGANTVTLTAVDVNGNLNTATATVTVQDLADPTASAQDITIELDATGNASITPDQVDNGSDDACGGIASMTVSPDSFDCEDLGTNTVTLTVIDGSGNSATATATVTVVDEVAPDVTGTFPADIILYADDDNGSIDVTPLGAAGAASVDYSDNCSGEGNKTYGVAGQVPTGGLIITAIGDPNDAASTCRFVEIHNSSDADINLTGYALQRWTNDYAGPSTGSNIDLSAIGTMAPGTYAHIANNAGFEGCYGFAPSIIAGSGGPADSNGDDNIAIIDGSSNIIDMFGVAGEDGSNTCHEFEDGVALRAGSNTDPNGGAWDESGWIVYSDGSSASGCTNHNSGQSQNASDIALLINNWAGAGPVAPQADFNSVDISYSDETTSYTASACYTFERTWTITVTDASGNATTVTDVQAIQVADTSAPDITALANTTAAWDLFSFDLSAGDQSTVLAYTSFEEGTSGDQYVDTGDAAADHALANNPGQSEVNFTSTGGEMGFSSYYYSTGSNGLTDGDFVGVTSFTGAVGAYTDGSQGFQMQDTDGIMELVFDNVDVSTGGVTLTLDYFVQSTGWETSNPEDIIRIWVVTDGGEVDLLNTQGQDIDNLGIEGQWNMASLDLDGYDSAELHISLQSNSGSESLFIDNVAFSAGNSPLAALEANGYVSFSDNVELASTEAAITLDGNTCDGAYDIVYTATDSCGNTTTMAQHIDLEDAVNPAISDMPANITQTNDAGNCAAAVSWTAPTSSDNCSVDTFTSDYSSGGDFPVGTTTVTYTAADASGNTTTSTFTVTVTDDEAPVISGMPSNITQSSDVGLCTAVVNWTAPTAADNCGIASFTSDADSGDAFGIGENTVTYTATDIHGNTTTASFTITVEETEDPTIAGMPSDINQTNDPGVCGAVVTWTAPTAADNCGIASFTPSHAIGSTFDVGTTTVTYTATDLAGNTATATFDVTITFDDNPAIAGMPSDITQTADAGVCDAVITWVPPTVPANCGDVTLTSTHNSGDTFAVGATTVSYTAEDIHGNTTTSTFTVTVTDDEDPAISGMPSDITQTADAGECEADVTWTAPTASDNCAIATFTSDANAGDAFAVGSTTVTYTATDIHGNSSTGSFTITVTDDEDPVISGMPADITQSNEAGDCSAAVSWTAPTASDNCGVASLTTSHAIGSVFAVGNTTVTYTATDVNGNTSTASFTVTITDDEDPVIAGVPADMTLSNDGGDCSAEASWTAPTATDNCGIASFTSTHDSGDAFAVGTTTVSFTASDVNGNTTTETFTVTVTDDEDPTISGTPANITLNNDAGDCSAVASWTDPTAADNCAIATFTSTHNSGDAFAVGTTTVTYTATDIHSNTTTSTFTVTVTDNEQPVISGLPSDITQTADAGECEADVTWTAPTAADNCAIATFTSTANPGDAFPEGMTTVTYTATDIHGNSSTGSFTITVTDDEDPAISGTPANITQSNDAGNCSAAVSWTAPTASDNCGVASLTATHAIGSVFAVGTTTVTYTATDINGNTSTSSFTVTVTDDEDPVISPLASDHTYQRDGGEATAFAAWLANYGGAAATDNCGLSGWSNNSTGLSDDCGSTGTETVTFTATDIHSNTSTTSATFTVIDTHAPSCPLIDLVYANDDGPDQTDNITNDASPTVRVMFTGIGVESAEAGDVVELYIQNILTESYTIDQTDVDNGYATFEIGPFGDGPVMLSARHIDDCDQASIFAFLNVIINTAAPILEVQPVTVSLDAFGFASVPIEDFVVSATDDFGTVNLSVGGNPELYVVEDDEGNLILVDLENQEAEFIDIDPVHDVLNGYAQIMMYDAAAGGFLFTDGYSNYAVTNDAFEVLYTGALDDGSFADGDINLDCVHAVDQAGGWIYAIERSDCAVTDSLRFFRFRFDGIGEIEAELLHTLASDVNGNSHDFESMAVDLEGGIAYLVGDHDLYGGSSSQELWMLVMSTGQLVYLGELDDDTEAMWFDEGQLWLGQDNGEVGLPQFEELPAATPYVCGDPSCAIPDTVQFVKADDAETDDSALWDHITDNVALFRSNSGGLYNALSGGGIYYKRGATGSAGAYISDFQEVNDYNVNDLPGDTLSLYIPEGDLCFDLVFSSWTCCGDGGGFAYERIHVPTPSILVGGILGSSEYLDLDDFNGSYNTDDIQAAYFGRVFTQSVMLDCGDTDAPVEVVVRAEDIAGNVTFDTTYATVIDDLAPTLVLEPHTVYLSDAGEGYFNLSDVLGDATMDNCSYAAEMTWDGQSCGAAPKYGLTAGTLDANTSNCDDCTSLVPLGFDFTFYGETYNQVYISSNGLLQFESSSSECCDGEAIPDSDYEAAIAVIHTDLDPDERDDANIYYQTLGTAPNREFVVSWSQVSNYEDNDIRHDGQAVLYEATGQVDIFSGYHAYLPDDCDDPMTTGISNQDGTLGMAPQQFVENCAERGNLYITFTPDGDNYAMDYEVCSDFTCSDVGVVEVAVTLTDPSGNATSGTVEVTVVDEVAPLVVSTPYIQPLDENGEATYDLSNAVATDACGIQSFEALTTLDCEVDAPETGSVDFEKLDDTSGPEATDFIGWDVALTRGNSGGLYNALTQNSYNQAGPDGTLWKLGAADSENQWTSLYDAVDGSLDNNLVGTTLTMVTLQSQRFFEVAFTSWSCCGDGGFAYTRTEVPTASGLFTELEPGTGCDGFVSETVSFEKMDYDDPSLVHDSIAPGVWISRGDDQGLINAATGESWDGEGPSGTLWRVAGSGGAWSSFYDVFGGGIGNAILSTELELWVPSVNQVWHMDFTSWTQGGNGGGFAYTRTSLAPCAGCTSPVALDYDPDALFATPCDIPVYEEVELVATDVNGNVTHAIAYMAVADEMAPEVNLFDLEDYTLYAGESCVNMVDLFAAGSPWYEATDNCDVSVEILYDEINETGIAGCREFDRRWIIVAEDPSGNVATDTTLQHITVIDNTAPTVFLDGVPADTSVDLDASCSGAMPAAATVVASATDNCTDTPTVGPVTYTDSAPAYLCGDAGSYTIVRTYMATATDACGNAGMVTATQTVTFNDVTAPQITDSEGIANGETLTQEEATGLFDFIFIPGPADLEADDACSDVSIEVTEVLGGFIPTETADNFCGAATPEAFTGADACNGGAPAAIVLEGMPFNGAAFTIVPGGVNIVESRFDQTISIEVEVENADGTGGFIWNADYNAAIDWTTWTDLGRGYKKDCADVLPGASPWINWNYFVMQTGGMLGTGIYAGSELSLTHQPMNYYYGLQVGLGANNQNANYGASAWFYWSGELVVNGASQGMLGSSGDIMLDLDCVMPWTASYDYTVTDACGNETTFGYAMTNAAMSAPVDAGVSGEGAGHHPFDVSVGSDLKEPIRVTGLQPNPTNDISQLGFVVSSNMRLRIDLYDMAGQLVQELFDGNAMNNVEYFMAVDAQGLDAGMYQIRLTSDEYMAVKKLLVTQ